MSPPPSEQLGLGVSEYLADGTLRASSVVPINRWVGASVLTAELDEEGALRVAVDADPGDVSIIWVLKLQRQVNSWEVSEVQVAPGGGFHGSPDLLPTADGRVRLVWLNNPTNTVGEGTNSVLSFSAGNEPVSEIVDLNGEDPTRTAGDSDAALLGGGRAIAEGSFEKRDDAFNAGAESSKLLVDIATLGYAGDLEARAFGEDDVFDAELLDLLEVCF